MRSLITKYNAVTAKTSNQIALAVLLTLKYTFNHNSNSQR